MFFSFWNNINYNYQMIIIASTISLIFVCFRSIFKIIIALLLLVVIFKFGFRINLLTKH
ncbi:putative membrane protein [Candidatus Phytoplasma solani]